MGTDARWTIGTIIAAVGLLALQVAAQFNGVNAQLDAIEARLTSAESRLLLIEEHLRAAPAAALPEHP